LAVTVEKLKVDLQFDSTNLRKGFADAVKDVKYFGVSIEKLNGAIQSFAQVALKTLSVKAVFDEIKTSVLAAADAGSALVDMRDRTGIAIEALEHLKFAADQSGASIGQLEIAVKKMQKEISHGTTAEKFAKIGLSIDKLRKLNPEDQLLAIGDAISKLPNPTARAAAAQEIFGKSGTDLLPMFKDGKNGIAALVAESKRLGGVWTTESAEAAEKFGDQLSKLQAKSDRFAISIGNKLIPVLQDLSDLYVDNKLPESGGSGIFGLLSAVGGFVNPFGGVQKAAAGFKKINDDAAAARRVQQRGAGDQLIAKLEKVADVQLKGLQDFFAREKPNAARDLADALGFGDALRQAKLDLVAQQKIIAGQPKFPKQAPNELGDAIEKLRDALGVGRGPAGKLAKAAGPFEGLVNGLNAGLGAPIVKALEPLNKIAEKLGILNLFGIAKEKPAAGRARTTDTEVKALQFGSAEALSAVAKSQNAAGFADKVAEKQLKEAQVANARLNGIIDAINRVPGWRVANI
jgi:hypothetical protein